MGASSVPFYANFKAIFCVALVATLTNIVLTQNLFTSMLDDTRSALMSFSSGGTPSGASLFAAISSWRGNSPLKSVAMYKPGRRRRRRASTARRKSSSGHHHSATYVQPSLVLTHPSKKRASPSNKFLEALDKIEKAMYEAQATGSRIRHSKRRLEKIKANIKSAVEEGNYLFARQSLGRALYSVIQLGKKTGRKRRAATKSTIAVKNYMDSIKKEIGDFNFDAFMSVYGEVTLMFAIDDTGSMGNEIQAAKDIAISIVDHKRKVKDRVNYILSPFNDPGTGPVTSNEFGEGNQFVRAINSLKAHGGGDCPELTFEGIRKAIDENPFEGSPLYVFTDATAKDYTEENLISLLAIAIDYGITINFFTTNLCGRSSYAPFETLAMETSGQMFNLPSSNELKKLAGFTAGALAGATSIATGKSGTSSGKKKRSVSGSSYSIPVDDSTEKLIVSVTTERRGPSITLNNPRGHVINSGKIYLTKGAIYEINSPMPGAWKLTISRAGKHTYQVKGSSDTNVDFEHFFVMVPTRGRRKKPIPISHPLLGEKAFVIIAVAGAKKINKKPLSLDLMSMNGRRLGTAPVTARGRSNAHFSASFDSPSVPFRLKLRGTTKKGNRFERYSRNIVHPSHALIRVLYARNEFTIPAGGSGYVLFVVHNTGPTEMFDIKITNRLKLVHHLRRSSFTVRRGRRSYISVTFKAPSSVEAGKGAEVLATVTGRTSKKTVGHVVRLMIV